MELSYHLIAGNRNILLDNLKLLNENISLIKELQSYSEINLYDYSHILEKTFGIVGRIIKTFPDCFCPVYIWRLLEISEDKSLQPRVELLTMVLRNMQEHLLRLEDGYAMSRVSQLERQNWERDAEYHRLVAQRVIANYSGSTDPSVQEILSVVRKKDRIDTAYNYHYVEEYFSRNISEYGHAEIDKDSRLPYTVYMGKNVLSKGIFIGKCT